MLAIFLSHLILLPVLFIIGCALICAVAPDIRLRLGDRIIVSLWLGLFIIGNLLILTAVFYPLKPPVTLSIIISLLLTAFSEIEVRSYLKASISSLNMQIALIGFLLLIGISFLSSIPSDNIDTGAYHFQFAKWLSEYGVVKGVGLVMYPLAISTSWLPLTAALNHGILEGRCHGIVQGLLFFIFILHLLFVLVRVFNQKHQRADIFLLATWLIIWPNLGLMAEMSVNTAVACAIVTFGFLTILFYDSENSEQAGVDIKSYDNLLLVFSFGASSLKITALPLAFLVLAWIVYVRRRNFAINKYASLLAIIFLISPPVYSVLTSGYPFFLSSLFKFDLPWAFTKQELGYFTDLVKQYYSCEHSFSCGKAFNERIIAWIFDSNFCAFLVAINGFFILFRNNPAEFIDRRLYQFFAICSLSCALLIVLTGPSLTYSLGWLALFPAAGVLIEDYKKSKQSFPIILILFAIIIPRLLATRFSILIFALYAGTVVFYLFKNMRGSYANNSNFKNINLLLVSTVIFILIGKGLDVTMRTYPQILSRIILPDRIFAKENCEYHKEYLNDVSIWKVKLEKREKGEGLNLCECWDQELPCSGVHESIPSIRLRSPKDGISGGFIRAGDV